ncbi:MAG: YjjG family noncanonical pyrimidine nucleotidase [Clostridia bacterium]|nr:YjjG family noncanonical pyrimidine nucleotidase [Clostridia bacterium]
MKYKAILFDNDDTLMDFQAGNRNAVNQLMDELGYYHPDRYEQYERINLQCWDELERGLLTQSQVRLERFTRFFDRYPVPGDAGQSAERFAWLLGQQSIMLPNALEVVRRIAEKLPVVIVTNGMTSIQRSRFARSPLTDIVSGIVISEEIGVSKPRPEIFLRALEPMGAEPSEALMIGDGIKSDILGANNAGIDACWLNPGGRRLPEGVHAEYEITDIRECVEIALQG